MNPILTCVLTLCSEKELNTEEREVTIYLVLCLTFCEIKGIEYRGTWSYYIMRELTEMLSDYLNYWHWSSIK
ncbi:hypothetical protein CDAR_374601 [Caerostris darwini]|uniref:Uncharacterized protein n=1 Tax=Caerostris darwini TaxID=1538125 RepID=A0AAV4UDD1_9ARAC|nr:hypothetical protein CDAR_374601 [Caerostris darwini]